MPLISVVIATYKRPDSLKRAVHSALNQSVFDIEVIVAVEEDDHSSIEALDSIKDQRVRHIINPIKRGPGIARDLGARQSTAEWIAFLDDDDEWLPSKLEKQLNVGGNEATTIVMTLSTVITPHGAMVHPTSPYSEEVPIDEWLFDRRSWFKGGQSMLQTSSLMMPRKIFEHVKFGESRHEEWELVIRAVKQFGFSLRTVREPLVIYRTGNTYPWRRSIDWIEKMADVITARAYSGFCLTVATKGVDTADRNEAFATFFRMAFRRGRPTLKQLLAFALIWLVPDDVRHRLRIAIGKR